MSTPGPTDRLERSPGDPLLPRSPSPTEFMYPTEGHSGDDLFSPPHWARDGIEVCANEVDATIDELKDAIVCTDKIKLTAILPPDDEIRDFLQSTKFYDWNKKRWLHIPPVCNDVRQLFKPMRAVMDAIMEKLNYTPTRPVFDSFHLDDDELYCTQPHQRPDSRYRQKYLKRLPHMMAIGTSESNFGPQPAPFATGPSYASCISPVELQTEVQLDYYGDLAQLAWYARNCFKRQQNRNFVYSLLVTEANVVLYVFDRSGVCHSRRINIHTRAIDFIKMVLGVWSPSDKCVGFDTTVYWECNERGAWHRYIKSTDPDDDGKEHAYLLTRNTAVFDQLDITGRGTTCWAAYDDGRSLLIKSLWREEERTPEANFLWKAQGMEGVGQIILWEEGDCTSELRGFDPDALSADNRSHFVKRKFCRMILENYGPATIEQFDNRAHLLHGIRDAIIGHQKLFNAGILHCDISMGNILLRPQNSGPGHRGVLIDLDLAMWVGGNCAPFPLKYHNYGTTAYMSLNVLETHIAPTHELPPSFVRDHLDDLESFYYLLSHICSIYTAPRECLPTMPAFFEGWEQSDLFLAAFAKRGSIISAEHDPTPYFGPIFRNLLDELHRFFAATASRKKREMACRERTGAPGPSWNDLLRASMDDYSTILGFIDQAILELEMEEHPPLLVNVKQEVLDLLGPRISPASVNSKTPLPAWIPTLVANRTHVPMPTRMYYPFISPLETSRYVNTKKRALDDDDDSEIEIPLSKKHRKCPPVK